MPEEYKSYDDFEKFLLDYESDTFSASSTKLTKEDAHLVALALLKNFADNRIDGLLIGDALDSVRKEGEYAV